MYKIVLFRHTTFETAVLGNATLIQKLSSGDWQPVFSFRTCENVNYLIDTGVYDCVITHSPKFHQNLPLIDVPGHSGIRIHSGNTEKDTTGCILVGEYVNPYFWISEPVFNCYPLIKSRKTLSTLMGFLPSTFKIQIFDDISIHASLSKFPNDEKLPF